MRIEEVVNSSQIRAFLDLNPRLQKGNPFYIQPLDEHIEEVFNPSKNKAFKYGTAKRWIVKSESNEVVGRIAAFTTSKYINKGTNFKTGGVGLS